MRFNRNLLPVIFFFSALLAGCGATTNGAPDGSTITINVSKVDWTGSGLGVCSTDWVAGIYGNVNFHSFAITVRDKDGLPLNNVDLYITLDLSANTATSPHFVQLFDDSNWTGGTSIAPANPVSTPFKTRTEEFGTKRVIVGVDLDCGYGPIWLNAFSGNAMGSASIKVQ